MKLGQFYLIISVIKTSVVGDLNAVNFGFNFNSKYTVMPKNLNIIKQEFEALDYKNEEKRKLLLILTNFLLSKELSDIDKLKDFKVKAHDHQNLLATLKNILISNNSELINMREGLGSKNVSPEDILYVLGNFLISGRGKNINELDGNIYQKKLKVLGYFLISNEFTDSNIQKILNPKILSPSESLKLLQKLVITDSLKESDDHFRYNLNDANYIKRLKFFFDYLLSDDPTQLYKDGRISSQEDYKEVLKEFNSSDAYKKLFKTSLNQGFDSETNNHEVFLLLQKFFQPGAYGGEEDLAEFNSKISKYNEELLSLRNFFLLGLPETEKMQEINEKSRLLEKPQGDSNENGRQTDFQTKMNLTDQEMLQRNLQEKSVHAEVQTKEMQKTIDVNQQERLKLLGEFLTAKSFEQAGGKSEKFDKDYVSYQKKLKLLGYFLLSKNRTKLGEFVKPRFDENSQEILYLVDNLEFFNYLQKILCGYLVSDFESGHQEVLTLLIEFILPGTTTSVRDLEKMKVKSPKHQEIFVLLGDFLLFGIPTNAEAQKEMDPKNNRNQQIIKDNSYTDTRITDDKIPEGFNFINKKQQQPFKSILPVDDKLKGVDKEENLNFEQKNIMKRYK